MFFNRTRTESPALPNSSDVRPDGSDIGAIRTSISGAFLAAGMAVIAVGCSADDADTVYPESTEFGPADTQLEDVDVVDGTEGGLDLDNGNVENSTNDDDLDPFDEENDLNTDESEPESDPSSQ